MTHIIRTKLRSLASLARYVPKRASLVGAITLGVLAPAITFAWGPSDRDTYTMQHAATKPVFNSITNNPVQGDERDFMQIRQAGQGNDTYANSVSLKADTEYVVYIYYHNDANRDLNGSDYKGTGIAHGAYVKADFPDYVNDGQTGVNAEGYVGATNATPKQVFDEVTFSNKTGSDLSLSYVKGSATIHNKNATDGMTLSDSIVTNGAKIGWKKLDGTVPGCSDYSGYVTLRFKTSAKKTTATTASTTPSFTIKKQVRLQGTTAWHDSVSAKPGDTLEYLATYTNTALSSQKDVVLKDTLPAHVSYVKGSSELTNGQNPSGKKVNDGVISSKGINVGDYAGGGVGYLLFAVKVTNDVACGTTTVTNGVRGTVSGTSKGDTADVKVTKTCTTTTTRTATAPPATTTPPTVTGPTTTAPATMTTQQTTTQPATTQTTTTTPVESTTTQTVTTTAPADVTTVQTQIAETTPAQTTPAQPAPVTSTTTTEAPSIPAPTPSTGPAASSLIGSAFGAGSLGLGAHHYLQSRRTLRGVTAR